MGGIDFPRDLDVTLLNQLLDTPITCKIHSAWLETLFTDANINIINQKLENFYIQVLTSELPGILAISYIISILVKIIGVVSFSNNIWH